MSQLRGFATRGLALDDAHDVGFLHDEKVFAVDLDFGTGPFAEQNAIARLHIQRNKLAGFVAGAGSDSDDFAFLRLLLGSFRNNDASV